jgi:formimidoylglutamate deiminase
MQAEDLEAIAAGLYIDLLRHGYTAVAEFHALHRDPGGKPYEERAEMAHAIAGAAAAAGISLTLLPVLHAHGGFGHRPLDAAQRRFRGDPDFIVGLLEDLALWHLPSTLMRLGVGFHSVGAIDALTLIELVDAARAIDPAMPIHMPLCATDEEVARCVETHGVTPFVWISDIVDVDSSWCVVHAARLTDDEMRRMAGAGACAGLCPTTEAHRGQESLRPAALRGPRVPWGIGGGVHVAVSPFDELRAIAAADDTASDEASLWNAAAAGGAQALGQPIGALAVGRRADLVVMDGDGGSERVRDVYVGGRQVVEDGRHPDEDEALEAARAALRRLRAP